MDPVHAVPDILEHALVGHEQVTVFEACLTAASQNWRWHTRVLMKKKVCGNVSAHTPGVSGAVAEEIHQAGEEVRFCSEEEERHCYEENKLDQASREQASYVY